MTDANDKRVTLDEVEIEYEEHGAGERPFVLVHGFTGSRDDFREVLPVLAGEGRTVAPDQRGHGGSTNTGDPQSYTLDQLADDFVGFLDAAGIERCDLLGHSMGGMMALRFCLAHPDRVHSLVLMDTAARGLNPRAARFFELGGRIAREQGMESLARLGRAAAEQETTRPPSVLACIERMGRDAYFARIKAKLLAMDPEAFATLGPALSQQRSLVPDLHRITCPTLVVVGAEDEPFLEPSVELETGIPNARKVVIEGAAHSPQLENTEAWIDAVAGFLREVRG